MIARLRGTIIELIDDCLVVDVQGVGYQVRATSGVLAQLQGGNTKVDLIIHTEVRENDISLYGFSTPLERRVFLLLQKVKGIGARLGLQIVSHIGAESVLATIGQGSITTLCSVPGVGKKTAERILVELRELVGQVIGEITEENKSLVSKIEISRSTEDAVLALEKLGFPADRARGAVLSAAEELGVLHKNQPANGGATNPEQAERLLHLALTKAARY